MDTDDSILLRRWLSERDADAFVQVAMRHAKMVYRVALRILGNPHDAEEVAQDCFEALASTTKPPKDNLSGWLYQVAANQAKNRLRSEKRRQEREERFLADLPTELPSDPDFSWDDVHRYVDETILALPEIYREPLIAHFFEQQTHETIAQRLGLARSSVSHRIQQGIEAVRQELKKRGIAVTVAAIGTWFDAQASEISVPSTGLTEAIARIGMAGIGGTAVTSGSISLLGKVGIMLNVKWVGGGIAAALVVGGALFLGSRPMHTPVSNPVPAQVPAVTPVKEEVSIAVPVVETPKTVETAATSDAMPAKMNVEDPLASLWGSWSVVEKMADWAGNRGLVEISQDGSNIVIKPLGDEWQVTLTGKINGLKLQMTLKERTYVETTFFGTYTPNANTFTLSGNIGTPEEPELVSLIFTRVSIDPTVVEKQKTKLQRKEEVQAIYSALKEYKKNFEGQYPKRLEDAAKFFKGDTTLLTSSSGHEITYHPSKEYNPEASPPPALKWDSEIQYADQIVAVEAHLHENGMYDYLFQPALVTVKYSNPAQRIAVDSSGNVREEGYDLQLSEEDAAKYCASCQNNLKQIGLSGKMFANETHGFIMGGWAMTYPEYMTDTSVFSCPCQPIGNDSYELLFPAVNTEAFCLEMYGKVVGGSVDSPIAQSTVPMIVERSTHTVKGKQGRNVLFFDGHAEFVAMNDLPQKVDRFVKANK